MALWVHGLGIIQAKKDLQVLFRFQKYSKKILTFPQELSKKNGDIFAELLHFSCDKSVNNSKFPFL